MIIGIKDLLIWFVILCMFGVVIVFVGGVKIVGLLKEVVVVVKFGVGLLIDVYIFFFNILFMLVLIWFGMIFFIFVLYLICFECEFFENLLRFRLEFFIIFIVLGIVVGILILFGLYVFIGVGIFGFGVEIR